MAVSALFSLRKGLAREALSLTVWLVSIWAALQFAQAVGVYLPEAVEVPSLRLAIGFVALLLAGVILGNLLIHLIVKLVDVTGLTMTDRVLGMVFGTARGAAMVVLLVFLLGMTPVTQDAWWRQSVVIGYAEQVARELKRWLPADWDQGFIQAGERRWDRLRNQAGMAAARLGEPSEEDAAESRNGR